jgi:uncharacterized protein
MKFTLTDDGDNNIIRSYNTGELLIKDSRYTKSVIVTPKRIINNWTPQHFADITSEHFNTLLDLEPQLVILGTGSTLQFPSLELYATLIEKGIGVEVMATPAACRTYNILVSEGRNVAAALLLT